MFGQCWYVPIANCKRHVRVHSSHPTADKHALAPDTPSSHSSTCFIAMCFMHCTLFSLLRLVYIINSNSKGNSNNNIASSAQAQHLTYPCLFLLLMKKVVPLIIICHCIRMCAAIEIQLRISVSVCMYVCVRQLQPVQASTEEEEEEEQKNGRAVERERVSERK